MTGETVHIAVPHGDRMLIVGRVDSLNPLRVSCEIGTRRDAVALSITGPSDRWTKEKMMTLAPGLLERVETIRPPLALQPR